jgi:hypothetical protein
MRVANEVSMHHFVQKHVATSKEVSCILHLSNVFLRQSLLHLSELLIDGCCGEEEWAHGNIMVLVPEPAIVSPSITSNLLALRLNIAPILRVFATNSKVVIASKFEVSCSSDVV